MRSRLIPKEAPLSIGAVSKGLIQKFAQQTGRCSRNEFRSSIFLMLIADAVQFRVAEDPGEGARLLKAAGHRCITYQEPRDFGGREAIENLLPLAKNWARRGAIFSHPATEILASEVDQLGISANS